MIYDSVSVVMKPPNRRVSRNIMNKFSQNTFNSDDENVCYNIVVKISLFRGICNRWNPVDDRRSFKADQYKKKPF